MIKILVVEDERAISDLIRMNLEDAGYACTCVYDGMAAADQIETQTFDLVLLDIMLPKVNGYELLEYIKPTGTPVIFLTAKVLRDCVPVELTPKEFMLLEIFVRNRNITLFRDKIYELVWENDSYGDTRTLDLHVQRLRKKLGLTDKLRTIYKVGYRLED